MLKSFWLILKMEILLHLRRSQEWLYPLGFFLVAVSLFPLACTPDPIFLQKYAPGYIWLAALFASLLALEHVFSTDQEDGYLEQLLLSPTPVTLVLYAKLSAQWLVTALPLILLTPLLGCLFHLPLYTMLILCSTLLLGTPILTLLGSLMVALTLGLRHQGILLSLLILPLTTPILIFATATIHQSTAGFTITGPLTFLAGLSILAITVLPAIIATTLRLSMDN